MRKPKGKARKKAARRSGIARLTPAQGRALFEHEAHRLLGMSASRFKALWRAGRIEDPDRPEVLTLAALADVVG
jgi:hypothetical protein